MCSVHAGCFIFSCCLAPFKCVHTGRWNAACLGIRKGAKWRLWCEKRLRTPQLVVLGICVLLLLPVVLFIAFFLPSIPLIASSSSSPWNKCYCLQPLNCAWPQYKLLFTTIGYISLCCVMCVCVWWCNRVSVVAGSPSDRLRNSYSGPVDCVIGCSTDQWRSRLSAAAALNPTASADSWWTLALGLCQDAAC